MRLTDRVNNIKPSPTMAVTDKARQLRASGRDVIGLGAGEPDFDTPEHIKQAGIEAIQQGMTNYTAADGTPELKEAIAAKFERENNIKYSPSNCIASVGAKHCIFNVLMALIQKGDEVLIPQPVWVSYPDMVVLCDGVPVPLKAGLNQQFKVTPDQIDRMATSHLPTSLTPAPICRTARLSSMASRKPTQ